MVSKVIVKWLKLTFVLSTASFVIIQIQMRRSGADDGDGKNSFDPAGAKGPVDTVLRITIRNESSYAARTSLPSIPADSQKEPQPMLENEELSAQEIRQIIENHNAKYEVYNENEFGPVEIVEYVVVIQVHNRSKYLEQLINSLSQAKGIERTLLIFSHDYYSSLLNNLIKSVTFCRVMQIFYPYSMQVYPDRFPGQDPKDCPSNVGKEKAEEMKCQNWKTPDKYGHYRVSEYSQVKHHWWWKMNYVYNGIPRLRNYSGWVLRLEEDHYVSPDFLHTFDYMVNHKETLCDECRVITLGVYLKSYNAYSSTMDQLAIFPWFSSRHNMGMAINRSTWIAVQECSELFCTYDDYNWDWSLMRVNLRCLKQPMTVIYAKSPRVFHIGDCGIHHTGKQCTADSSATQVRSILEKVNAQLYPKEFRIGETSTRTLKAPKENGGWGDVRDHELCRNNSYFHQQLAIAQTNHEPIAS